MVAETKIFLELDFSQMKKILSSSELHISSEVEIFGAADAWIKYDDCKKSSFGTVRQSLL